MATTTAPELVTISAGLVVPLPALKLLWALEDRGLDIKLDTDAALLVGPRRALSEADKRFIRQYREPLRALVAHCEREQ